MKFLLALPALLFCTQAYIEWHRHKRMTLAPSQWHDGTFLVLYSMLFGFGALTLRMGTEFYSLSIALLLIATYPLFLYGLLMIQHWLARHGLDTSAAMTIAWIIPAVYASTLTALIAIALGFEALNDIDWVASFIVVLLCGVIPYVDSNRRLRRLISNMYAAGTLTSDREELYYE